MGEHTWGGFVTNEAQIGVLSQASVATKQDTGAEDTHRRVDQHKMTHDCCASATSCGIALNCVIVRHAECVHLTMALTDNAALRLKPWLAHI